MPEIESHPFPALLPPKATVMMMGTFPPKAEKHAMQFHYPNFINDMWRVYGLVFFNDAAHFQKTGEKAFDAEKIKAFLHERGIASCPTVLKAVREQDNASDKFLRVVETVDLPAPDIPDNNIMLCFIELSLNHSSIYPYYLPCQKRRGF